MGPVNIAVDSYGPVTDNAQSVFELAQTEHIPGIKEEIKKDFGFEPDFEGGKHYLEANDSAGNTFKATAKPVLIGTAVVGRHDHDLLDHPDPVETIIDGSPPGASA
jgi:K(+)-stimulated pyrophosphate-energized sodium pump